MPYQLPCFVISATEDTAHRDVVRARLESRGLKVSFFPLTNPESISEGSLDSYINANKNISECGDVLNRVNVAIALSHIAVYRHILNQRLPSAIILEDDVDVCSGLASLLDTESPDCIEHLFGSYEPVVVMLTHVAQAWRSEARKVGNTPFKLVKPYGTVRQSRGYFITNAACHNLVKTQYPIWTSADHWEAFVEQDIFRLWALTPNVAWACESPHPRVGLPPQRIGRAQHLTSPIQKLWDKTVTETLLVKKLPERPACVSSIT